MLVDNLDNEDRISIVVYADGEGLVLPSTPVKNKAKIINSLSNLEAGGSTAGGSGIKLAYKVAKENIFSKGNNRIVLATDGDFNVGVSSTSELVRMIEQQRKQNIALSILGFGRGNLKDSRMEEIADKGNGNYFYIDNILEAKKVLVTELTGTLYTIAKDVKIQVEFNPAKVESYRLIGYENRKLNNEDFKDDTKDAGEIGSGHTVTALYEIVPAKNSGQSSDDLKYQQTSTKKSAYQSGEIATLKFRYKPANSDGTFADESILIEKPLMDSHTSLQQTSANFRFSAAVAELGMLLRDSEFIASGNTDQVIQLAKSAKGKDEFGYRAEFINLAEKFKLLKAGQSKK